LKPGQCVIVPTMTFAATAEVVRYFGARPILADCRSEDFNLDVADAEQKIKTALEGGQQVTAIIPVHYGGQIGDVSGVTALAKRYQLKIIEDAAHCCPAYFWTSAVSAGPLPSAINDPLPPAGNGSSEANGKSQVSEDALLADPSALSPDWLP